MIDILLQITDSGTDLLLEDGDLAIDESLATPALVSVFSDARAPEDEEVPDGTSDPRGWWAEDPTDPFGSLLWLEVSRSSLTPPVIDAAEAAAAAGLEWMIREEILEKVEVVGQVADTGALELELRLSRGSATLYAELWKATVETDFSLERFGVRLIPL